MTRPASSTTAQFLKYVFVALAISLLLVAVGYLPTKRLAGSAGVTAQWIGCGISLVGSWLGYLPIAWAARRQSQSAYSAVFASMGIRFAVVLTGVVAVALSKIVPQAPLLIWTAISYLALLASDTRYAVSAFGCTSISDKQ